MNFGGSGRGRGGGRGRFGGRGRGRGLGPTGICKCMKCGREMPHNPGIPCNQTLCPICNVPMMRVSINQISLNKLQFSTQNRGINQVAFINMPDNTQQMMFPVVDEKICTGCAECINQCPNGAITIVDNKAVINYTYCRNCRTCENICPRHAIH